MTEIFRPDIKLIDFLAKAKFTVSTEVIPPRNGTSQNTVLDQIEELVSAGSAFLSVTKGAGGSLRGGSLPIAHAIKDHFARPSIAHFACRDLTPEEVENQLMDHHYFGIRNILALRGDPPRGIDNWQPREGSYPYAYLLMEQIVKLNSGVFIERKGYAQQSLTQTDFCIGSACYPDEKTPEARVGFLKRKVEAGAEYSISQMLFSVDSYRRYLDECDKVGVNIPILPGTRILKSKEQARRMASRFEVKVPDSLIKKLPSEKDPFSEAACLECFQELIEGFKKAGAPGVHIFVLQDTELTAKALREIGGTATATNDIAEKPEGSLAQSDQY